MIRSFLYSVFLHSILLFFTASNYIVSNKVIRNYVHILENEFENNIISFGNIKSPNIDSELKISIDEKINLYQLAKVYSDNRGISMIPIKKLSNIYLSYTKKNKNIESKFAENKKKYQIVSQNFDNNDIIFLGPSDYKKLLVENNNIKNGTVIKYNYDSKIEKNIIDGKFKIDMDKIFANEDIEQIKEKFNENYDNMILSKRERFSIQNQIIICYKNALIQTKKASKFKAFVKIEMKKNGYINMKTVKIDIPGNPSMEEYNIAFNNIITSLNYCNPLRNLPIAKYDAWKVINLVFNGN